MIDLRIGYDGSAARALTKALEAQARGDADAAEGHALRTLDLLGARATVAGSWSNAAWGVAWGVLGAL